MARQNRLCIPGTLLSMVHATLHLEERNADDLVGIFARCFALEFNTELVSGAEEPLYLPAESAGQRHRVYFSHDYFASALHEVAHWCLAGEKRRQELDYGYWYAPDGRSPDQQKAFERVEVKPQAIEWHFSAACGVRFRVSADNLAGACSPSPTFKQAIATQAQAYSRHGLPPRAARFALALARHYRQSFPAAAPCFAVEQLR